MLTEIEICFKIVNEIGFFWLKYFFGGKFWQNSSFYEIGIFQDSLKIYFNRDFGQFWLKSWFFEIFHKDKNFLTFLENFEWNQDFRKNFTNFYRMKIFQT